MAVLWLSESAASAQSGGPFRVDARAERRDGQPVVIVEFGIPAGHFLYADYLAVKALGGASLVPVSIPEPVTVMDQFSEEEKQVYPASMEFVYAAGGAATEMELTVSFQGCDDTVCFFPEKKAFRLSWEGEAAAPGAAEPAVPAPVTPREWGDVLERFDVGAKAAGYLGTEDFLAFLEKGATGRGVDEESGGGLAGLGVVATVLVIVIGGIGLNLTPCVLPLIPVNLAIIGAGAKAGSRARGFALGAAYGLGMALVYGALGLAVVMAGAKFGALNSSAGFNAAIAVVFVVLALAMFDVIKIDLAHFQATVGPKRGGGRAAFALALVMGAVAALLAGACVAPAVISVLLLSGNLYSKGNVAGLFLPFLLGLGMGLPWPFAGAGLSFLPKPGRWMVWVRNGFGAIILAIAFYYGQLAWQLFRLRAGATTGDPVAELVGGLERAGREGKPVFVDFWATWCKNCLAMEETTFKDEAVRRRLEDFVVVKFQAEVPQEPPSRDILDRFGAVGLPTYVVLVPKPSGR